MRARLVATIVALLVGVGAVFSMTACATGIYQRSYRGAPPNIASAEVDYGPQVVWSPDGHTFSLVTYGSSSCPAEPKSMEVVNEGTLSIEVVAGGGKCTADLGPTTYEFFLPEGVRSRAEILVTGQGETRTAVPSYPQP